jgi:hypothetical protein
MPRYVVQRTFPEDVHVRIDNSGVRVCRGVLERNAEEGVTWLSSYVDEDKTRTLHLRRAQPCGYSQDRSAKRAAGDHPGDGARRVTSTPE